MMSRDKDLSYEEKLAKWQRGDYQREMMEFIQKLLGYMFLGQNIDQKFVIFVGDKGRNGKGVLMHTLMNIFGNYVISTRSETFMKTHQRSSSVPTPEIVKLAEARIVIGDENDRGDMLDATFLKRCTGGDMLSGRKLFKDEITFKPKFVPALLTNYFPYFDTDDNALFSRIICIPFEKTYKEDPDPNNLYEGQIDTGLENKLKAEYPAILKWIVEGARKYLEAGKLEIPEFIQLAGEEYRENKDVLGSFLNDCCTIEKNVKTSSLAVYFVFAQWCYEVNIKAVKIQTFADRMKSRGFNRDKGSDGCMSYVGLMLNMNGESLYRAYIKRKRPDSL